MGRPERVCPMHSVESSADDALPTAIPSLLVDEIEAARLLSVSVGTLRNWWNTGGGPRRVGGLGRFVRYSRAELQRFVEALPMHKSSAEQFEAERIGGAA